jgi:hypothetical protein
MLLGKKKRVKARPDNPSPMVFAIEEATSPQNQPLFVLHEDRLIHFEQDTNSVSLVPPWHSVNESFLYEPNNNITLLHPMGSDLDRLNGHQFSMLESESGTDEPIRLGGSVVESPPFTLPEISWIVLFTVMLSVAIIGNIIIIWIIIFHRRMRTVTNYFLLNLSVADLTV